MGSAFNNEDNGESSFSISASVGKENNVLNGDFMNLQSFSKHHMRSLPSAGMNSEYNSGEVTQEATNERAGTVLTQSAELSARRQGGG